MGAISASLPFIVYRGIDALHPALEDAKLGRVMPGDIFGNVTPEEHNRGGFSSKSPYTSWTKSREIAEAHARWNGPGGVLLSVEMSEPTVGDTWSWVESPDVYDEQEVLLRGQRSGATVELL